jgi:hypothetical protein
MSYCNQHMQFRDAGGVCSVCAQLPEVQTVTRNPTAPRVHKSIDDCTPGEWNAASAAHYAKHPAKVAVATDQPAPVANSLPAAWDLVMADMRERDRFGQDKYGVRLQPSNGRDFLADAYQEALDLAVYLRGAIYERDSK